MTDLRETVMQAIRLNVFQGIPREEAEVAADAAIAAMQPAIAQARREALDAASLVAEAEINSADTGDGWQSASNIRNEILALIEKEAK